ncbi:MAG: pitrilysin family protein [bacterium]|nr:pitrilysin family protein [bacterium]
MRQTHESLRETVEIRELADGARLCVTPRTGRRCHAVLSVEYGALHEAGTDRGEPPGIAHFLEHRLFEKPDGDISERFTDIGADVDAQTGFTATSYSVTSGAETFPAALELLFELAGRTHFPEDSVARERSIVGHEIQLFEDNVEWMSFQTMLQALYPAQRIAVDIAGTPESLQGIDSQMLTRCHQHRYQASAVQVFACGPIAVAQLVDTCNDALRLWPTGDRSPSAIHLPVASPGVLRVPMAVPRVRRMLAFPDEVRRQGIALMRHELAMEMTLDILFGPRSEFFSRHYESGLLDGETFGGEVHMDESYGFCVLSGDADDPDALQSVILEEVVQARRTDWIETDFERARRRAYGDMVCQWEDVESTVGFLESAGLRGCHPFSATEMYAGETAINAADIRRCLEECLRPERVAIASVGG